MPLDALSPGHTVRFKQPHSGRWTKAIVQGQVDVRSCQIQTEDGKEFRRNGRHLRKAQEPDWFANKRNIQAQYKQNKATENKQTDKPEQNMR